MELDKNYVQFNWVILSDNLNSMKFIIVSLYISLEDAGSSVLSAQVFLAEGKRHWIKIPTNK